jgi:hypothetical protein
MCGVNWKSEVWRETDQQEGGLVLKQQSTRGLCWRDMNVGQERASNQQDELGGMQLWWESRGNGVFYA